VDRIRALVAERLEQGQEPNWMTSALARAWGKIAAANVGRPVALPQGAHVIGIGGAVLGGAGKTPVAIALAKALAERGHAVALVGHGYRAKLGAAARRVARTDDVRQVGDDALAAAIALDPVEVPVFVAKHRQDAMALAVRSGKSVLVVDGLLQTTPQRLDAAVLVLNAAAPFGSGLCPPLGDLRAPVAALLAHTNHVIALGDGASSELPEGAIPITSRITGVVFADGERAPLSSLTGSRVGLLVAIARPERVLRALLVEGIAPTVVLTLADHASFDEASLRSAKGAKGAKDVDAWLTTSRCATKLPPRLFGAPVLVLEHHVDVRPLLTRLERLDRLVATQTRAG
jgi:tetraacyldisaccharide 4'-kinase